MTVREEYVPQRRKRKFNSVIHIKQRRAQRRIQYAAQYMLSQFSAGSCQAVNRNVYSHGQVIESGKLRRDSLRYREAVELSDALGYDIIWHKRRN